MPFLSAQRIHDGKHWLPEGTVIEVSHAGEVLFIGTLPPNSFRDLVIFHEGVLAPGFVNVHCHLELSHLKGVVPEHTNLIPFLETIPQSRNKYTEEQKKTARHDAYNELLLNGVVAVGDIANTTDTLDVRSLDGLHVCTFIESIGFYAANAEKSFGYALQSYGAFASQLTGTEQLKQAIVPHAPYSVSSALFGLIDTHAPDAPISIHNQESEEENKFYRSKEGDVRRLLKTLSIDDTEFIPSGKSSLQSYVEWLSPSHPFIFVHNTHTSREDVQFAQQRIAEAYWCLCPNANQYIENRLPDIDMLISEGAAICIGTDSLASNHQLSVLSELHTIKQHYPALSWEALLGWATHNGACALQMQDVVGSIEVGKRPGILQITGLDGVPVVKRVG